MCNFEQMENYFSRPRAYCLKSEIADNIDSDLLPLSKKLSKKIISKLDKKSPFYLKYIFLI